MFKKIILAVFIATSILGIVGCDDNNESKTGTAEKEETKQNEVVIVDDEKVKITYTGKTTDYVMGAGINFLIENKLDDTITITTSNTSVDGFMREDSLFIEILPEKKGVYNLNFDSTPGVEDIENIEDLINVEGNIVVSNVDFTVEHGNYEFNIE